MAPETGADHPGRTRPLGWLLRLAAPPGQRLRWGWGVGSQSALLSGPSLTCSLVPPMPSGLLGSGLPCRVWLSAPPCTLGWAGPWDYAGNDLDPSLLVHRSEQVMAGRLVAPELRPGPGTLPLQAGARGEHTPGPAVCSGQPVCPAPGPGLAAAAGHRPGERPRGLLLLVPHGE